MIKRVLSSITMTNKLRTPFGSFPSPITTDLVLGSSISISDVLFNQTKNKLVWVESRPSEGGRSTLLSKSLIINESTKEEEVEVELLPFIKDSKLNYNVRTRLQEYGGSCVALLQSGLVFSSIEAPIFRLDESSTATPIQVSPGPESSVFRYADFSFSPTSPSILLSILEDHTNDSPANVVNSLILLDINTRKQITLVSGNDFYSSARFSSSGKWISWIEWSHPSMPWDSSILKVAKINFNSDGSINLDQPLISGSEILVAGGISESVSQPRWSLGAGEEKLVFLSDRTGFYELYVWKQEVVGVELVLKEPTGHDCGGPDWVVGQSTHAPLDENHWIALGSNGSLLLIDLDTKTSTSISTPYISISTLRTISPTSIVVIASSDISPTVLSILNLNKEKKEVEVKVIKTTSSASVDSDYISIGKTITFPTKSAPGEKEGQVAYGVYYEPTNKKHVGLDGELPPLVLHCHGGPTSSAGRGLAWSIQYFTSRGFAYVDVDYGGSTSYGKAFRERLNKNWGIVDVQDTIACVEYLVKEGKVDSKRVSITGGSAGGFTVLAALCAGKVFGAGTSLYGVSDLELLAGDTHKFESQYLFGLLGGTPQQIPLIYSSRSPINNCSNITAPLLILQGTIDRVVPKEQAQKIHDVLKEQGKKVELIMYEGEGHGFRMIESKRDSIEREVEWYRRTFGIEGGRE